MKRVNVHIKVKVYSNDYQGFASACKSATFNRRIEGDD